MVKSQKTRKDLSLIVCVNCDGGRNFRPPRNPFDLLDPWSVLPAEERFEITFFVDCPDGGTEEGEEEKNDEFLGTGRSSFLHRYRSALDGGECWGLLLYPCTGGC